MLVGERLWLKPTSIAAHNMRLQPDIEKCYAGTWMTPISVNPTLLWLVGIN